MNMHLETVDMGKKQQASHKEREKRLHNFCMLKA